MYQKRHLFAVFRGGNEVLIRFHLFHPDLRKKSAKIDRKRLYIPKRDVTVPISSGTLSLQYPKKLPRPYRFDSFRLPATDFFFVFSRSFSDQSKASHATGHLRNIYSQDYAPVCNGMLWSVRQSTPAWGTSHFCMCLVGEKHLGQLCALLVPASRKCTAYKLEKDRGRIVVRR